jgi:hypothetical protein
MVELRVTQLCESVAMARREADCHGELVQACRLICAATGPPGELQASPEASLIILSSVRGLWMDEFSSSSSSSYPHPHPHLRFSVFVEGFIQ